jgi:hypothetical protein
MLMGKMYQVIPEIATSRKVNDKARNMGLDTSSVLDL